MTKRTSFIIAALYIISMLYAAYLGLSQPYRNWDMVAYVGTVTSWEVNDAESMHKNTMEAIRQAGPDWLYQQHAENPLSAESGIFSEQLPFYRVKPLYLSAMWLLDKVGLELPSASWTVSAVSFLALAWLLFKWSPPHTSRELWLLAVLALTFAGAWPMASLARFSTPDALCALLLVAAFLGWIQHRSFFQFAVWGWLATLARTDALILSCMLAVYFALFAPRPYRMKVGAAGSYMAISLLLYGAVSYLAESYGWEILFMYSFVDKIPHPGELAGRLTWNKYQEIIINSSVLFIANARIIAFGILTLLALFCFYMKKEVSSRMWRDLLLLMWAGIAIRFLLFPAWGEDRYYYPNFLIILMSVFALIAPYAHTAWRVLQEHRRRINSQS